MRSYAYVDISGDIGPFQLAIALTVVSLVMIIFWPENYGGGHDDQKMVWIRTTTTATTTTTTTSNNVVNMGILLLIYQDHPQSSSMLSSIWTGVELVGKSPVVLFLGLSQSFFEGAVFTFGETYAACCYVFPRTKTCAMECKE